MTPEQWVRVQELFQVALEQPSERREQWLAGQTADPLVLADVRALLRADAADNDRLISHAIAATAESLRSTIDTTPGAGSRVGPYRLEREIGHGGMGAVWLGVRADDAYHARVAIKFVRGRFSSPDLAKRLLAERQILANLTHPNIAWLLDGGATDDGTPYLVMEHIDGEAIDRWCDRAGLGLTNRIALFTTVCDAVRYAHVGLVIHRDIKPSNILVAREGTPKLVDFGTAKLLADESDAGVTGTLRFLTPAYAAPEQVLGGRITVVTDVYALGGVLYRLVTGAPPHDVGGVSGAELERRICEVEPRLPSQVAREADLPWSRRLAGDLDTIILTALHKDPARRYQSVERLMDDLRRHGEGLPVLARPDSWSYRTGKFVRRHRLGVAAALATVTVLATLVAFYTGRLRVERDRATAEATKSAQVATFLVNVFRRASPQVGGQLATARDLLDAAVSGLDTLVASQPTLYSDLLSATGMVYRELGDYAAAEPQLRKLVAVNREIFEEPAVLSIQAKRELATTLQLQGKFAEAEPIFVAALAESRGLEPIDSIAIAFSLNNLAKVRLDQGRYREAEEPLREAAAIYARQQVERALSWQGVALRNLARAVRLAGDAQRADSLFALALPALVDGYRSLNPEHPNVSEGYFEAAVLELERGALDSARALAETSLAMRRRGYPNGHPSIGRSLIQLAAIDRRAGRRAVAVDRLREGDSILTALLAHPHPWLAEAGLERVEQLEAARGAALALPAASRVVAQYDSTYGRGHPEALRVRIMLARMLIAAGRCPAATAMLDSVLAGLGDRLGSGHPWVAEAGESRRRCDIGSR